MVDLPTVRPTELDELIEHIVVGRPMPLGRKLLGLEYERLILDAATGESAPLDFCRSLLADLATDAHGEPVIEGDLVKGVRADGFELSMEPGGQIEVAVPPKSKLRDVDTVVDRATALIEDRLQSTRFALVCVGHAPVTPVGRLGLLPRTRYRLMDRRMPTRGPLSRNMMRATAGFQITYDVADRDDAALKLALLYRLSPVLMALTANSRRIAGLDSGYASFRHHVWLHTDGDRSGVPDGCLHPETALQGYIEYAKRAHVLFYDRSGQLAAAPDEPLRDLVARGQITRADVELHLSGLFPFVRLRNYIEVRCFDSVEWSLARSVMALVSGIVYCEHASRAAFELSEELVVEDPLALRTLHEDAARHALEARAPSGRAFRELAAALAGFARSTLGGENCHWAEPGDLDVVDAVIAGEPCPRPPVAST